MKVTAIILSVCTLFFTTDVNVLFVASFQNCTPDSPLMFEPSTPLKLANFLVGTGVTIVNNSVAFYGNNNIQSSQIAKFSGGATIFENIDDMDQGIVLTTGDVNQPLCRKQSSVGIDRHV
jgi:hypothetical protein